MQTRTATTAITMTTISSMVAPVAVALLEARPGPGWSAVGDAPGGAALRAARSLPARDPVDLQRRDELVVVTVRRGKWKTPNHELHPMARWPTTAPDHGAVDAEHCLVDVPGDRVGVIETMSIARRWGGVVRLTADRAVLDDSHPELGRPSVADRPPEDLDHAQFAALERVLPPSRRARARPSSAATASSGRWSRPGRRAGQPSSRVCASRTVLPVEERLGRDRAARGSRVVAGHDPGHTEWLPGMRVGAPEALRGPDPEDLPRVAEPRDGARVHERAPAGG